MAMPVLPLRPDAMMAHQRQQHGIVGRLPLTYKEARSKWREIGFLINNHQQKLYVLALSRKSDPTVSYPSLWTG
jgi:hypothetical protein